MTSRTELSRLYETEHLTIAEVSERIGYSPYKTRELMRRMGIPIRDALTSLRLRRARLEAQGWVKPKVYRPKRRTLVA